MRTATALALAAVAAAVLPAHAAVLRTSPVGVWLGDDLVFYPAAHGLAFDASLGTLNGVTLRFDGRVEAMIAAYVSGPPYPTEITLGLTVSQDGSEGVSLGPFAVPVIVGDAGFPTGAGWSYREATASLSVPQSFDLEIPPDTYGERGVYSNYSFYPSVFTGPSSASGASFQGMASAVFDYTPAPIPEPASLALLGAGLALSASLLSSRRGARQRSGGTRRRTACLLTYDAAHHRRNVAETRRRQMDTGDLFADLQKPGG